MSTAHTHTRTPTPEQILASARLHLETAIGLVGQEQIQAWLVAPVVASKVTSYTTTTRILKTGGKGPGTGRGRKAGTIPHDDQRCTWTLTSGDRCANKKKDANALCGLHIDKVGLISDSSSASASASGSAASSDIENDDV